MSGHQFWTSVLEGLVASTIFAIVLLVLGAALRHWYRELIHHLQPVKQLERNGGSHLADAVYNIQDLLDEHLEESARDRRRLASLERRFSSHLRDKDSE